MKFRNRLRRLEEMLRLVTPPPRALLFTATPTGYSMRTGPDSWEKVTEHQMNELCAELPANAVVPMVLRMSNSRPETDPQPATVEPSGMG